MFDTEPTTAELILRRLDVLIMLALDRVAGQDAAPISGKIQYLHALGLRPSEIADIVAKPTNYVTATLSNMKKGAVARSS